MKVTWTSPAIARLRAIGRHIAQSDPEAARRVTARIERSVSYLEAHPALGRPGRAAGTRELSISRTDYIVVYRRSDDDIEVVTVFHARQSR